MTVFKNDQEKAEALDNSRPLDVHKWSDHSEVNKAVNAIWRELSNDSAGPWSERITKKHVKIVILDLYVNWLGDPDRYISYHRATGAYRRGSRYNYINVSHKIVDVIDALAALDYIESHPGFNDREGIEGSRLPRIKATDKLISFIKDDHQLSREHIAKYKNVECIILRDWVKKEINGKTVERKEDIEYDDKPRTRTMRKDLMSYNELLWRTSIEIPDKDSPLIQKIIEANRSKKRRSRPYTFNDPDYFVRRVFSNGSWDQGGRYHGGWWQRIPSDLRACIAIDGAKDRSVEVDYSGLHIALLYAIEGINYYTECKGEDDSKPDPYRLDEYEQSPRMRGLLKQVLLSAINAEDRLGGVRATQKEINFDPDTFGWFNKDKSIELTDVIEKFLEKHTPIKHYFYSGEGIKLQNVDSLIAEEVINHFTKLNVPILFIHDSFLCSSIHSNELIQVMNRSFKGIVNKFTGSQLDIEAIVSFKSWYDVLSEYDT
jgi:hypothetical protein